MVQNTKTIKGYQIVTKMYLINLQAYKPANIYWNETPKQVCSCKTFKFFKNTFIGEHVWTAASMNTLCNIQQLKILGFFKLVTRGGSRGRTKGTGPPWNLISKAFMETKFLSWILFYLCYNHPLLFYFHVISYFNYHCKMVILVVYLTFKGFASLFGFIH